MELIRNSVCKIPVNLIQNNSEVRGLNLQMDYDYQWLLLLIVKGEKSIFSNCSCKEVWGKIINFLPVNYWEVDLICFDF